MYEQPQWGTVNLGVGVLQGQNEGARPYEGNKQQYNAGRNQELQLNPESFNMHQNTPRPTFAGVHERIKELIGEGIPRREAVIRAKAEARDAEHGGVGTINKKQVIAPYKEQVQGFPYI